MPYNPTKWADGQPPALNAKNLNKIENGIKNATREAEQAMASAATNGTSIGSLNNKVVANTSHLNALDKRVTANAGKLAGLTGTMTFKGVWDIKSHPQEYPQNPTAGDVWLVNSKYTFTTGDLQGVEVVHGEQLIYDGSKWEAVDHHDATPTAILTKLKTVDGKGSGLDADKLDGKQATAFVQTTGDQTITGKLHVEGATAMVSVGESGKPADMIMMHSPVPGIKSPTTGSKIIFKKTGDIDARPNNKLLYNGHEVATLLDIPAAQNLGQIKKDIAANKTGVAQNKRNISTNTAKVTTLTQEVKAVEPRIKSLEQQQTTNNTRIADVDKKATANKTKLGQHTTSINKLKADVADNKTTLSDHTTSINKLKTNVASNHSLIMTNKANIAKLTGGVAFKGVWHIDNHPEEYPANPGAGDLWLVDSKHTFTHGDLTGVEVVPGEQLIYDGTKWEAVDHHEADPHVILEKLKTVDGNGSGLDADKLDGKDATAFVGTSGSQTIQGLLHVTAANASVTVGQPGSTMELSMVAKDHGSASLYSPSTKGGITFDGPSKDIDVHPQGKFTYNSKEVATVDKIPAPDTYVKKTDGKVIGTLAFLPGKLGNSGVKFFENDTDTQALLKVGLSQGNHTAVVYAQKFDSRIIFETDGSITIRPKTGKPLRYRDAEVATVDYTAVLTLEVGKTPVITAENIPGFITVANNPANDHDTRVSFAKHMPDENYSILITGGGVGVITRNPVVHNISSAGFNIRQFDVDVRISIQIKEL